MFDMSWGELMVIGGVALIVIGPKDLPKALRTVGQMTTKVRRMAGEFQSQFNEAMREAEIDDLKKEFDGINTSVAAATQTGFNPIQTIRDELKGAVEGSTTSAVPISAVEAEALAALPSNPTEVPSVDLPLVPMPANEPVLPQPILPEPNLPEPDLPIFPEPVPVVEEPRPFQPDPVKAHSA